MNCQLLHAENKEIGALSGIKLPNLIPFQRMESVAPVTPHMIKLIIHPENPNSERVN